jgi:hypothetical protein
MRQHRSTRSYKNKAFCTSLHVALPNIGLSRTCCMGSKLTSRDVWSPRQICVETSCKRAGDLNERDQTETADETVILALETETDKLKSRLETPHLGALTSLYDDEHHLNVDVLDDVLTSS